MTCQKTNRKARLLYHFREKLTKREIYVQSHATAQIAPKMTLMQYTRAVRWQAYIYMLKYHFPVQKQSTYALLLATDFQQTPPQMRLRCSYFPVAKPNSPVRPLNTRICREN